MPGWSFAPGRISVDFFQHQKLTFFAKGSRTLKIECARSPGASWGAPEYHFGSILGVFLGWVWAAFLRNFRALFWSSCLLDLFNSGKARDSKNPCFSKEKHMFLQDRAFGDWRRALLISKCFWIPFLQWKFIKNVFFCWFLSNSSKIRASNPSGTSKLSSWPPRGRFLGFPGDPEFCQISSKIAPGPLFEKYLPTCFDIFRKNAGKTERDPPEASRTGFCTISGLFGVDSW